MSGKVLMTLALTVSMSLSFLFWRHSLPQPPASHIVAVHDRSRSAPDGCTGFTGLVQQALGQVVDGRRATLLLLVTGDKISADEPVEMVVEGSPFRAARSTDAPSAPQRQRALFLQALHSSCERQPATMRSPIYQAAARAVEHVRQRGDERSRRLVAVQTDLEELSNAAMRRAARAVDPRQALANVSIIDNAGVDVMFCGDAETWGASASTGDGTLTRPRDVDAIRRLRAAWTGVFAEPQRVTFEPFCPKWHRAAPSDTVAGR
jgi:hypothetical protein